MKLVVLAVILAVVTAEKLLYTNYKLVEVQLESQAQIRQLVRWYEQGQDHFIFNEEPRRGIQSVKIVINPDKLEEFQITTLALGFKYQTLTDNFQEIIDQERVFDPNTNAAIDWTQYWPLEAQYSWYDELVAQYPGIVTTFDIGTSYEGRPIRGVKVAYKSNNPSVFIESNCHAREWVTSATATWVVNELLTSQDPDVRDIAENVNWYIIPVLNVDGFVYSHTTQRLWRKTRQPNAGSTCIGTDPNRNWDYLWFTGGSSSNPCSDTFAGPSAFSDVSVSQLAAWYNETAAIFDVYISFHSYSQLLMYPFAARRGPVDNEEELRFIGLPMVEALARRYGTAYDFGPILQTIYESSGTSIDWIHEIPGTRLTFLYEFRDKGRNGFILPPQEIIPNSEEVLDSLVVMVKQSREIGYLAKTDKVQPKEDDETIKIMPKDEIKRMRPKSEEGPFQQVVVPNKFQRFILKKFF